MHEAERRAMVAGGCWAGSSDSSAPRAAVHQPVRVGCGEPAVAVVPAPLLTPPSGSSPNMTGCLRFSNPYCWPSRSRISRR